MTTTNMGSDSAGPKTEPVIGEASVQLTEGNIAVVRLGAESEEVITLNPKRMASLKQIFEQLLTNPPTGVIILGSHEGMFTAGADINMIRDVTDPKQGEELAKIGQSVFNLIAKFNCPTVAAISGVCVGGGCELVLACSHRIISDHRSSQIGLPETKLGIIPGFGGTQRLPRLIGLPLALDIILAGKILKPKQALVRGLVDKVVKSDELVNTALAIASGQSKTRGKKPRLLDRFLTHTSFGRSLVRKRVVSELKRQTKGFYPAPNKALEACLYGLQHGIHEGLKNEAKELGEMITTAECKSLVHLFFLTEAAKSLGKSGRKDVVNLSAVVVGAGAMGAGIAGLLARHECPVILRDRTDKDLDRAIGQIKGELGRMKHLTEAERSFVLNRIERTTRESPNVANAGLAIEAVFEEIEIKRNILAPLAKLMSSEAIIATNTSSLSVSEIAKSIAHPERVVGMHFFNPVAKMPLVEIIRGQQTNAKTIAVTAALTTKLGKYPIVVEDVPGFLVNRILSPYLNEAAYLLVDGYSIQDIDRAALKFGMPMGPLRLLDEIGLDVAAHVADSMFKGYGARMETPTLAKQLVELGRKGKKSGGGFYDFKDKDVTPHPAIRQLLKLTKPEQRVSDLAPITERLIMALINEAVLALDEGVAGKPGKEAAQQIDLGTVMGIGFPPFRGGVAFYAEKIGLKSVLESLTRLEKSVGTRYKPAAGIKLRVDKGRSLYS